jgi:hypothetical protein
MNGLVFTSLQISVFVSMENVFRDQLVSKNQSLRGNALASSLPINGPHVTIFWTWRQRVLPMRGLRHKPEDYNRCLHHCEALYFISTACLAVLLIRVGWLLLINWSPLKYVTGLLTGYSHFKRHLCRWGFFDNSSSSRSQTSNETAIGTCNVFLGGSNNFI